VCPVRQVSVGAKAAAAAPAGKAAKVYGPALEKAVRTFETTYLIVDCKDAGPGCNSLVDRLCWECMQYCGPIYDFRFPTGPDVSVCRPWAGSLLEAPMVPFC